MMKGKIVGSIKSVYAATVFDDSKPRPGSIAGVWLSAIICLHAQSAGGKAGADSWHRIGLYGQECFPASARGQGA